MAENDTYTTIFGSVEFEPNEREVAGKTVRNVAVRPANTKNPKDLVSVTVWPENESVGIERGDFIAVTGKLTLSQKNDKTYRNLSAQRLVVFRSGTVVGEATPDAAAAEDGDDF